MAEDDRHDPGEAENPLGDLAADVGGRSEEELDDIFEEAFTEMEVEEIDAEDVWAELERDETPAERVAEPEQEVRVQHKNVCHGCQYFSEPPAMHCTHEGTEIREVVDAEHYEVVDCPMGVAEDLE